MVTKIDAAKVLMRAGIPMVICDGHKPNVIVDAAHGANVGTTFDGGEGTLGARKLWIAFAQHPKGSVVVDAGATDALCLRGKSLLPSGIRRVDGDFERGDAVSDFDVEVRITPREGILDPQGNAVAHALRSLEFAGVEDVRIGRLIRLHLTADTAEAARAEADRMCRKLLANPVTEDYDIRVGA